MFLGQSDLLTDLLALMCYQNYRFPVELQLGSQRCVFDCRLEQHQREGKRDSGMRRARGRVSAATNPIISFLRGLGKSNGWLGQSWGPVIHCTHFLCQYVPLTPSHSSLSWRHQPISSTLLGPDPERASDVSHTWTSGLDMFKHYRALI